MAKSIKLESDTYLDASGVTALENRIPLSVAIQSYTTSASSYTINAPRSSANNYSLGLMLIGTGSGAISIYGIWAQSESLGNEVQVIKLAGNASYTFTTTGLGASGATYSRRISLTASNTVWGGIRVLWLA